jgi:hypothetical protein
LGNAAVEVRFVGMGVSESNAGTAAPFVWLDSTKRERSILLQDVHVHYRGPHLTFEKLNLKSAPKSLPTLLPSIILLAILNDLIPNSDPLSTSFAAHNINALFQFVECDLVESAATTWVGIVSFFVHIGFRVIGGGIGGAGR